MHYKSIMTSRNFCRAKMFVMGKMFLHLPLYANVTALPSAWTATHCWQGFLSFLPTPFPIKHHDNNSTRYKNLSSSVPPENSTQYRTLGKDDLI